ncbi:MAG: hypothetical protein NC411_09480 [Bacteroides sp.]|nr:hypothetical protein [Bacteroides sp.]
MKKNLFLALLLTIFMVSCQDNVINDFEETTPGISRSVATTADDLQPASAESTSDATKSRYVVRVKNSYYDTYLTMIAVRWEVSDLSDKSVHFETVNDYGLVYNDGHSELVGYFEAEPGEYIVEAFAENLGGLETECTFKAEKGGEIYFEMIDGFGGPRWAEPIYTPAR